MDKILEIISTLHIGDGNTVQIYGIAHLLIIHKKEFRELDNLLVDIILENKINLITNPTIKCIVEGKNINNYYISHYYNFSLNLLCYEGLRKIIKISDYRKDEIILTLKDLENFLIFEKDLLDNDEKKTIGFELVVGKYISNVRGFKDKKFIEKYINLRNQRLKNFSPIIVFSPEGISGITNQIKAFIIVKKIIKKTDNPRNYLFCSPQTTVQYIKILEKKFPGSVKKLITYIKERRGLPPKFNAEFFDLFWCLEILDTAGLIDDNVKNKVVSAIEDSEAFHKNIPGCYNEDKGFSITKYFPLYDLDTTSVAIKALHSIGYMRDKYISFNFSYYKNINNNLYFTYKNDNRISITVLAHALHAQIMLNKVDENLVAYLNNRIKSSDYTDKFHTSILYTIYCLINAYSDYVKINNTHNDMLEKLVSDLLNAKKDNGLFGAIEGINGTIEETAWAIISLYKYWSTFKKAYVKDIIISSQNTIKSCTFIIEDLEKEWIIKDIYNPHKINTILIQSAMNICI
ncbi:MAG: hypothetical protein WCJ19_04045 [bacterium]